MMIQISTKQVVGGHLSSMSFFEGLDRVREELEKRDAHEMKLIRHEHFVDEKLRY